VGAETDHRKGLAMTASPACGRLALRSCAWVAAFAISFTLSSPAAALAVLQPQTDFRVAATSALPGLETGYPVFVAVTSPEAMDGIADAVVALGATIERTYSWNAYRIMAPDGEDAESFAQRVGRIDGVRYACVDHTVRATGLTTPSDPYFNLQWGLKRVGGPASWIAGTGSGVDIAIIDSGLDTGFGTTNPDFAGKIADGINLLVDASPGDISDPYGHGTHVAGIAAAAANNGVGVAGVAPGARLIIVKALNALGTGSESIVAQGIRWAVDSGAEIVSMSLGDSAPRGAQADPLGEAVAYAQSHGVLVVAAAGNDGAAQAWWPAAYPGVVAVGATDQLDRRASFSSFATRADGSSVVVLSAPGTYILSWYRPSGSLAYLSGTSMAAPIVAGAAAVVWSANPSWDATQVVERLTSTALDLQPAGRDTATGFGRLRLDVAMGQPVTPDDYEPDNTVAEGSGHVLSPGVPQWHNLAPLGDRDVAFADLAAGHRYSVSTSELSGGADTALTVLAPDGSTPVGYSDDRSPSDRASEVVFIAPQTGRYVVMVDDPRLKGGGYTLTAAESPAATAISIRSKTSRPRAWRYFTLTGALSPGVAGRTVLVEVLRPGTHHWARVGAVRTSGSAVWSRRYRPTRRGVHKFRVRFGGDYLFGASVSRTFSIRVR
jgi:subtilisin family serine protease